MIMYIFVVPFNKMRPQIVKIILLIYCIFVAGIVHGQQQGPPPPQRTGTPPVGLPIDNHIVFLIICGILLGGYFLLRKKKANL